MCCAGCRKGVSVDHNWVSRLIPELPNIRCKQGRGDSRISVGLKQSVTIALFVRNIIYIYIGSRFLIENIIVFYWYTSSMYTPSLLCIMINEFIIKILSFGIFKFTYDYISERLNGLYELKKIYKFHFL